MAVQMNFERDKLFDELGLMRLRESYMRSRRALRPIS